MVVAPVEVGGDPLGERAEALAHRLLDRLGRLESIGATAGVDADALGQAMSKCDDCSVTVSAAHVTLLLDCLTLVGHDRGQDATLYGAEALEAQPRPALALALAMKRAARSRRVAATKMPRPRPGAGRAAMVRPLSRILPRKC